MCLVLPSVLQDPKIEKMTKKIFWFSHFCQIFLFPCLKVTFLLKFPKFLTNARIHGFFVKIFTIFIEDIGKHLKKNQLSTLKTAVPRDLSLNQCQNYKVGKNSIIFKKSLNLKKYLFAIFIICNVLRMLSRIVMFLLVF